MCRNARLVPVLVAMTWLLDTRGPLPEAGAGPTICTVTINSSNERDALRAVFPEATFVELTDFASDDPSEKADWLPRACRAGVQCDSLLISGHFANKFFGDTRFELPMRVLEQWSCDRACDGVLKRPQMVYLFGCNTLATKRRDRRSPRQYRNILIEDGLDPDAAERVVALRYGPLGDETRERVRTIFAEGALIFGFSSVGPVGSVAGPPFRRYLLGARSSLEKALQHGSPDKRTRAFLGRRWVSVFEGFSPAFTDGGTPLSAEQCRFRDSRTPRPEKLRMAERVIAQNAVENALLVYDFLEQESGWSGDEAAVLRRIGENRSAADEIANALPHLADAPRIYFSMLRLTRLVGWSSEAEFRQRQEQRLRALLGDGVTHDEQDLLCSGGFSYEPPVAVLERNRGSASFIRALACLSASSPPARAFLTDQLSHPSSEVRLAALESLTHLGLLGPADAARLREIFETAQPQVRAAALWALASSDGRNAEAQRFIAAAAMDPDTDVAFASGQVLLKLNTDDVEAQRLLAQALGRADGFVRRSVALVFESLRPRDARVLEALGPYRRDPDPVVQRAIDAVFAAARRLR